MSSTTNQRMLGFSAAKTTSGDVTNKAASVQRAIFMVRYRSLICAPGREKTSVASFGQRVLHFCRDLSMRGDDIRGLRRVIAEVKQFVFLGRHAFLFGRLLGFSPVPYGIKLGALARSTNFQSPMRMS